MDVKNISLLLSRKNTFDQLACQLQSYATDILCLVNSSEEGQTLILLRRLSEYPQNIKFLEKTRFNNFFIYVFRNDEKNILYSVYNRECAKKIFSTLDSVDKETPDEKKCCVLTKQIKSFSGYLLPSLSTFSLVTEEDQHFVFEQNEYPTQNKILF